MKNQKQKLGWVLFLALWPSYSQCEPYTYGTSPNAASAALSWSMGNILPSGSGLDINGLIYRYRTVKNTEDDMKVHISNKNANGAGYIFRETDDWSGVPSNTILKQFSLANIPAPNWGDGSIEIEGQGSIEDAVVIYTFRMDKCFDPQADPSCAGYKEPIPEIPEYEIYNALEDDAVVENIEDNLNYDYDEDETEIEDDEEEEKETRLELGLTASANAMTLLRTQGQSSIINAMNIKTNIDIYYNSAINGGIYKDTTNLSDAEIPDNKNALRNNLAQQVLHNKLVDMQYNK
jgi:hypothetical protein